MGIRNRLAHAWNAFSRDPTHQVWTHPGASYSQRPDRPYIYGGDQRSRAIPIINHIAIDCSSLHIRHCLVDQNDSFLEEVKTSLNDCLKFSPNLDQSWDLFIRDCVTTMCEEGVVAIVPVETTEDPTKSWFDITQLRAGKIIQWYPHHIQVEVYNELSGRIEPIMVEKKFCAIVENPLYAVMNEPNATAKRLISKTSVVDRMDSNNASDKLNLLIHVPYTITNQRQQKMADDRMRAIEKQVNESKYGVAYIDGSEKVTQLNRPADNTMREEIKYLDMRLLNEYGLTEGILNGTASEEEQLNYYNHVIQPIMTAITSEMTRKYISKTARVQGERIMWFKDPFKLVPVNHLADVIDKFSRNEILTGNEIRGFFGIRPSDQESANELRNKNIAKPKEDGGTSQTESPEPEVEQPKVTSQNGRKTRERKGEKR